MTDDRCIICPALHPTSDPQWPDVGQSCSADFGLITSWLRSLPDYWGQMLAPPAIEADGRTWMRPWMRGNRPIINLLTGQPIQVEVFSDPVGALAPVGPVRGASGAPRVSGGDERPLGVPVGLLDLMLPVNPISHLRRGPVAGDWWVPQVRTWSTREVVEFGPGVGCEGPVQRVQVQVWHRELARDPSGYPLYVPAGDQVGQVPIARWLDQTVQAWMGRGAPGRYLPEPTVELLVAWLLKRLEWAVVHYPDLAQFAIELRQARGALRVAVGEGEDQAEPILGVRCGNKPCSTMGSLVRTQGWIECTECGATYYGDKYDQLLDNQAAETRPKRKVAA
jgi:hypothetical protein